MALPAYFLDELRARTPMAPLVGRRVPLQRSGRDLKGRCPFHGEKTPSFYVYADHYHCFGCGAHGDAISYVMQSQGIGFLPAVEQLAAEAGLSVPQDEAAATTRAERAAQASLLDAVRTLYTQRLQLGSGRPALEYLRGRGITEASIATWGLGWSGGDSDLAAQLSQSVPQLIDAGLMTRRESDGVAIDFFRNRVMFPIADTAGHVVGFGARTLGDAQPKYLNSPETAVFAKRRTLFGLDQARETVRLGGSLIVVEGYLDVIAMHQAGETGTVAPLGTALTEEQLAELWRLAPDPILCFDGDAAGRRACLRAVEVALPRLGAGRSLRIATLPDGTDPHDAVTAGRADMVEILNQAVPLVLALPNLLRAEDAGAFGLAQWRNRLTLAVDAISDAAAAQPYRQSALDAYFEELAS